MNVTFETCRPPILLNTSSAISSPASVDGPMLHAAQDGPAIGNSGRDLAPASLFPVQDGDVDRPISGIYGPTFIASSVPQGPLSSWESRLRDRMARYGSIECALIWRSKRLPSGRLMSRLTPSERLTSVNASTGSRSGWVTPTVHGNYNRKGASVKSGDGLCTQQKTRGLEHAAGIGRREGRSEQSRREWQPSSAEPAIPSRLGDAMREGRPISEEKPGSVGRENVGCARHPTQRPDGAGFWHDAEDIWCEWDQKWRRAKPSIPMLVDGLPGRVHEFTIFGNAVVAPLAQEVIAAYLDCQS